MQTTTASSGTGSLALKAGGTSAVNRITLLGAGNIGFNMAAPTSLFHFAATADTALTAGAETTNTYFALNATRQHASNTAIALQRDLRVSGSTHAFATAGGSITDCAVFSVDGPAGAGTNASVTNAHGIYMPAATITGTVTNAYGLSINAPSGASNNYAAYLNGTVGIGTASPSSTALLDVSSTTKGFLPPRMTTTQKNAIGSPTAGMVVYDSTLSKIGVYNGSGWDALSGAVPLHCDGRLTLTSGTAVTTADVTAATSVYFTPYKGSRIALFDGTSIWTLLSFTQLTLSVPATTATMYDIFAYNNAGTVALEALAWTNDTTRATALVLQDGVYSKSGATTRRYLGSFRTTGTSGQTEDSLNKRYLWNYCNRIQRRSQYQVPPATTPWTYSTASWRQSNASSASQAQAVIGIAEEWSLFGVRAEVLSSTATPRDVLFGLGLNSITTPAFFGAASTTSSTRGYVSSLGLVLPATGLNTFALLEWGGGADTQTWYAGSYTGILIDGNVMG